MQMSGIFNLKDNWDNKVVTFRNKAQKMLNANNEQFSNKINPFLDQKGNLINPYINYQKVLDNPNISTKVKNFISNATGLLPNESISAETSKKVVIPNDFVESGEKSVITNDNNAVPNDNNIVKAAKNYIGTPYVWGGESMAEGGMDCSGFVYSALKDAGYNVGRTTAQGYRSYGTKINKSDMQPGDLVFYGKDNNASHIGIYIGNGQMIHSSGGSKNTKSNPGKGVSVANVDYRNDFLEARRY